MNNVDSPLPLVKATTNGVRTLRFTDDAIQRAVDRTMAALPEGTAASIVVGKDKEGLIIAGAVNLGKAVTVMGVFHHRADGDKAVLGQLVWKPGA